MGAGIVFGCEDKKMIIPMLAMFELIKNNFM